MADFIRRVVTGHDRNGKAIVISDGPATAVRITPTGPATSPRISGKRPRCRCPSPPPRPIRRGAAGLRSRNGTKIRIAEIPPSPRPSAALRRRRCRKSSTRAATRRHRRSTRAGAIRSCTEPNRRLRRRAGRRDHHAARRGDVRLKAGDIVIQRGTNHAWSNRSGKPVRMLYILIDGKFEPELAQYPGLTRSDRPASSATPWIHELRGSGNPVSSGDAAIPPGMDAINVGQGEVGLTGQRACASKSSAPATKCSPARSSTPISATSARSSRISGCR